jgi:hypothetical protein
MLCVKQSGIRDRDGNANNDTAPTTAQSFWNAEEGRHSVVDFTINDKTCKFQQVGVLVYTWRVPDYLDGKTTYRLKLSTTISNGDHLSGPLRIGIGEHGDVDGSKSRMAVIFGLVCFLFVLLVFSRWLLRFCRKRRREYIRMG